MKLSTVIIALTIVPTFCLAQHSKSYLEIMNNLTVVDSSSIETTFRNGSPKFSGTTTYYKFNGKEYSFLTGKHVLYYRDGSRTESTFDAWGTILYNKYFDKNGNLISDSNTILLDTTAKDLQEFENSNEHITFVLNSKDYKCSPKLNKCYLYRESQRTNGKKTGVWRYYLPNGELKKEKKYQ